MDDLSKRIRRWREAKGYSQSDLARAVGVSSSAVCLWEGTGTNAVKPRHGKLAEIAKAVGVSMAEFWGPLPKRRAS